jgi:DNA repair exonuclease SbcCD ATPase subunit
MSFVDKLKSVFIVADPSSETLKEVSAKASNPDETNKDDTVNPADVSVESSDKFMDILLQVLENSNQPGFDYLEFRKAVQSIAKLQNLEEATQFKSAYAAAMSMNVQPNQLVDSAKRYLMVLDTEYTKFNQTASQFLQTQVSSKEQESTQLNQTIQQKETQLAQLQSELEKHHKRLLEIDAELKSAKSKVDTNKSSFKLAYDQLVGQISNDIQKMEQYLK